jgi:hypothetical protein
MTGEGCDFDMDTVSILYGPQQERYICPSVLSTKPELTVSL